MKDLLVMFTQGKMVKLRTRVNLEHLLCVEKKTEPEADVVDAVCSRQVQVITEGPVCPVKTTEEEKMVDERRTRVSLDPVICAEKKTEPEVNVVDADCARQVQVITEGPVCPVKTTDEEKMVIVRTRKRARVSLDHLLRVEKKTESEANVVDADCASQVQVIREEPFFPVKHAEERNMSYFYVPETPLPSNLGCEEHIREEIVTETEPEVSSHTTRPKLSRGWINHINSLVTSSKKEWDAEVSNKKSKTSIDNQLVLDEVVQEGKSHAVPPDPQVPSEAIPFLSGELVEETSEVPEIVAQYMPLFHAPSSEPMPSPSEVLVDERSEVAEMVPDTPFFHVPSEPMPSPSGELAEERSEVAEVVPGMPFFHVPLEPMPSSSGGFAEETSEEAEIPFFHVPPEPMPSPSRELVEEAELVPDMPYNPHWIKPQVLLKEMWEKHKVLRKYNDLESEFIFPSDDVILNTPVLQIPELMVLKGKLNETKSRLDHFPLQEWHIHTKQMNIANNVMLSVKRLANPEFSSQAWGKMFEMLCCYDIIPADIVREADAINSEGRSDKVALDTIHLCEAPGAFVSALNHFLKISYPAIDWNWMATTLNPYHESNDIGRMINDDRLILMSMENWTFLEDYTGNILTYQNLKHIVKERQWKLFEPRKEKTGKDHESVGLVTADGSIDCQTNPSDQEKMVAPLHFGEIVTALMLLHKGGTFILKIFTFLEAATICHLYLLSCVFKQVELFKPTTSKEGNSEVYVICLGYLGKDSIQTYKDSLDRGKTLFPLQSIPPVFMDRLYEAAHYFCNYQMNIIMRNISCFPCDTRVYEIMMKPAQKRAAKQWIEMSSIEPLPVKDRLFSDERMRKAVHVDAKGERGCFADKVHRINGDHLTKLAYIKAELQALKVWETPQNHTLFGGKFLIGNVRFERSYKNIRCSRFCHGRLLSDREEIREISKHYVKDMEMNGLKSMENICMGHNIKRVYKSMAKSCDVMLRDLEVLCFMKMTYNFVSKTDFEAQRNDLKRLVEGVKDLEKGRSMFLCRFPMLSRLQTGLIYCLTAVFDKVIIYADPEKNVVGIMLHQYKGLSQPENKKLFHSIDDIIGAIEEDEFDRPVLEMVPVKTLLNFYPVEFLLNYNTLLNTQDMLRAISVVEGILKQKLEMRPAVDHLTAFLTV
ncbi:Cap-specific mRNA (nucleoside-2'-O-)-methyltransferase 2 [Orchesella cincta]|uniref:Cap-specific mRNA (nucleoside-2'-O-)-methyltransferase 2 n=1 Tax=Orchesella cincta TaxID=48709 RepID=A0A1D2NGY8_ORCCI|nr:Cap-specific mRNA (nucleoside-2'-O-)-methyltransferase 2 [Orchesella cincta]